MSRTNIRALIALNALMLGLLGLVTFAPRAMAQVRVRGDFTMVAGNVNGADSSVVYIVDAPNQEMIAVKIYQGVHEVSNGLIDGVIRTGRYGNLSGRDGVDRFFR